jgi:hypothetical protein
MYRMISRVALLLLTVGLFSAATFASSIPIGWIDWNVTTSTVGEFDIVNQTGPNASVFPDTTFPVTTSVNLSSLSLTVNFTDGSKSVFGSSYFTLVPDGLSFDGGPIPIGGTNPLPVSATLTGTFGPLTLTLNDGSTVTVLPTFSATITDPTGGPLQDGDLAIIYATTSGTHGATPEPSTLLLLGSGLISLGFLRRKLL